MDTNWWQQSWPYILTIVTSVLSIWGSLHAILRKRDVRSALGWTGLIILSPGLGVLLYFLFGINRVRRKALALRSSREPLAQAYQGHTVSAEAMSSQFPGHAATLLQIAKAVNTVVTRPLVLGNSIEILENGEEAFPALLEAIRSARTSISLVTYIFSYDSLGQAIVEELVLAKERGVEIRVLIDAVGDRYHSPSVRKVLRDHGIAAALFIPIHHISIFNLRTHRKICVIDGSIGFTGGMNLRINHLVEAKSDFPTADLHFRLLGPVVTQLQEVFAEDWHFATKESLSGDLWFRPSALQGQVICRGIADGPDDDIPSLAWTLHAAIGSAQQRIRIVTPYFLPEMPLATALGVAASRGIEVDILIPSVNNLPLVHWASVTQIAQLASYGCRFWLTAPPFDHTKIMTVDGVWSLIGSSNWDARSLRLNFEFNCEAYDRTFAQKLDRLIESRLSQARRLSLQELNQRHLGLRLRDGMARLLSPYL